MLFPSFFMGIQVTLSLESPHLVAHRWMHCESVSIARVCAPIKWIITLWTLPRAGAILGMDLDNLILNEPCEVGSIFNPTLKMNKVSHRLYKLFGQCHTGLTPPSSPNHINSAASRYNCRAP